MFTNASDHAKAMCELYRTTRPSAAQLETLLAMAVDGTGSEAWDFDPSVTITDFTQLSRDEASRLLSVGYTVRRLLGIHPVEDVPRTRSQTRLTLPTSRIASSGVVARGVARDPAENMAALKHRRQLSSRGLR